MIYAVLLNSFQLFDCHCRIIGPYQEGNLDLFLGSHKHGNAVHIKVVLAQ